MFLIYVGLFVISAATLVLEITLTRVLAIAQWHHFAFWVISIAMLGFGVSGTLLSLFPDLLKKTPERFLSITAAVFCLSCVGSFLFTNSIPLDQFVISWDRRQVLYLALYYLSLSIPFLASGLCMGFLLSTRPEDVGYLYFSTMTGSGMGCIVAVWLASLGAPIVIVCASALGAISALLFRIRSRKTLSVCLGLIVFACLIVCMHPFILKINVTPYKDLPTLLRFPHTKVLSTSWNAFSKIDVIEGPSIRYAPGLSFQFQNSLPKQLGITWDEDAFTALTHCDDVRSMTFTDFLTSSLVYHLTPNPKVLVLGVGGGLDVVSAIHQGAEAVTGVEMNPLLMDVLTKRYYHIAGDVFRQPKVRLVIDEGRSYLHRCREKFDVIQIALLDSQTSASAGAYGLSENYVYTVEAFKEYLDHLTPEGGVSITRWLMLPPRDCLRLCAIALHALNEIGVDRPEDHIVMIRSWGTSTFILKRSPFSSGDAAVLKQFCTERCFDIIYYPGMKEEEANIYNAHSEPYYYRYVHNLVNTSDRSAFFGEYLLDIRPTTDNRPFFHHCMRWDRLKELYHTVGGRLESFILWGDVILMVVLGQAIILSLVLVLLPLSVMKRRRLIESGKRPPVSMFIYFLCLGFGFMLIEIVLIQKFILLLGRPVYALSVILFSVLLFSGCGSLASSRVGLKATAVLPIMSIAIMMYLLFLSPVIHVFLGQSLTIRILVSIGLLAPLSFLMGFPFPLGIHILNRISPTSIPLAWGINSCASVVGSIAAVAVALYFGFSIVFVSAGVLYMVGLGMLMMVKK